MRIYGFSLRATTPFHIPAFLAVAAAACDHILVRHFFYFAPYVVFNFAAVNGDTVTTRVGRFALERVQFSAYFQSPGEMHRIDETDRVFISYSPNAFLVIRWILCFA
jgi:hypothetical protein